MKDDGKTGDGIWWVKRIHLHRHKDDIHWVKVRIVGDDDLVSRQRGALRRIATLDCTSAAFAASRLTEARKIAQAVLDGEDLPEEIRVGDYVVRKVDASGAVWKVAKHHDQKGLFVCCHVLQAGGGVTFSNAELTKIPAPVTTNIPEHLELAWEWRVPVEVDPAWLDIDGCLCRWKLGHEPSEHKFGGKRYILREKAKPKQPPRPEREQGEWAGNAGDELNALLAEKAEQDEWEPCSREEADEYQCRPNTDDSTWEPWKAIDNPESLAFLYQYRRRVKEKPDPLPDVVERDLPVQANEDGWLSVFPHKHQCVNLNCAPNHESFGGFIFELPDGHKEDPKAHPIAWACKGWPTGAFTGWYIQDEWQNEECIKLHPVAVRWIDRAKEKMGGGA